MCTAIAFKGNDLIYGFNLDIDPEVWKFSIYKTKSVFALGVTVGKTTYFVHGVNRDGHFGNVPYMNGESFSVPRGVRRERIDLLNDRYIRGKYSFADVGEILRTRTLTCIPEAMMHSLIGSPSGDFIIVEPGCGSRRVEENYAVLTNFPTLTKLPDYANPFYGKDRYDAALAALSGAGRDFSAEDALRVLYDARQTGQWGTRVSFVYSRSRGAVEYFLNGDMNHIETHTFG